MPDLTRLQNSQPVQLVDANDLQVCDITTTAPTGTESGLIVRNIPSGTQTVTGSGTTAAPAAGIITVQGNASGVAQPVSGTITATPTGTYTVAGTTTATPTGTYTVAGTTTAVPSGTYTVAGTVTTATPVTTTVTGSWTASGNSLTISPPAGQGLCVFTIHGTYATGLNFQFSASDDGGTTFYAIEGVRSDNTTSEGSTPIALTVNQSAAWLLNCQGGALGQIKAAVTSWSAPTGTATVKFTSAPGSGAKSVLVQGDVPARGVTDSGSPVKLGAVAVNVEQTAATNVQRQNLVSDLVGKLITLPYANPENMISGTASTTTTTSTQVLAAQGAGVRSYVTTLIITNSAGTATYVQILDGAAVIATIPAPATSGAVINLPVPIRGTANTALNFTANAATTTVFVTAFGYKGS